MMGWIIAIIIAFLAGGAIVWAVNKMRRNKAADNAAKASEDSKDNDVNREDVLRDIEEVIKKNEEIRNKIRDKLRKK